MMWENGIMWWFIITLVFIGVELMAPALVSIWFALAALVLTLTSGWINNFVYEFYIFVVLSGVFLLLTRPMAKKLLSHRKPIENRIYGQEVKILKVLEEDLYEVKLDGKYWRATSTEKLEVGDHRNVEKLEGNKLRLKKIKR